MSKIKQIVIIPTEEKSDDGGWHLGVIKAYDVESHVALMENVKPIAEWKSDCIQIRGEKVLIGGDFELGGLRIWGENLNFNSGQTTIIKQEPIGDKILLELTKSELVHLICGYTPSYKMLDSLKKYDLGEYSGSYDRWSWNKNSLTNLSEDELLILFDALRDEENC